MLKKAFDEYKSTGKPPIRALVMDYTHDRETYGIDDEYIFCDDMIVAPMTAEQEERRCYLPAGDWEWHDYFTGAVIPSGWVICTEKSGIQNNSGKNLAENKSVLPEAYNTAECEVTFSENEAPRVYVADRIPVFVKR